MVPRGSKPFLKGGSLPVASGGQRKARDKQTWSPQLWSGPWTPVWMGHQGESKAQRTDTRTGSDPTRGRAIHSRHQVWAQIKRKEVEMGLWCQVVSEPAEVLHPLSSRPGTLQVPVHISWKDDSADPAPFAAALVLGDFRRKQLGATSHPLGPLCPTTYSANKY